MGRSTAPSRARYLQIEKRQNPPGRGQDYIPAILATREEAPAVSRPCKIWSAKFGRDLHTLSTIERDLMLIALYHPGLVDMHEQRALSCLECEHPLQGHPRTVGQTLPTLRGTVAVAHELDMLQFHPTLALDDPDHPQQRAVIAFPWIGDFLLFLEDAEGLYCVNWTVKASPEQFEQPLNVGRPPRDPAQRIAKERARHAIEFVYYQDGGVPTRRLTKRDYHSDVAANLTQLYAWHARRIPFASEDIKRIEDFFRASMALSEPPIETMLALIASEHFTMQDLKAVLYQAIWKRSLRVDLFQPIVIDRPLQPETRDVLKEYAAWFERG